MDLFSYVFSRRIKIRLFLNELCFHDINGFKFIVTQMMVINFTLSFEMDLFLILYLFWCARHTLNCILLGLNYNDDNSIHICLINS